MRLYFMIPFSTAEHVLEEDTLIVLTWIGDLTIRVLNPPETLGQTNAIKMTLSNLQTINGCVLVLMLIELTQNSSVTITQPLVEERNLTST